MYKSYSPYITLLKKSKVKWQPYTLKTLKTALVGDKIIYIHIGDISNHLKLEKAIKLFNDDKIAELLNSCFIPIALDTEDIPEAYLAGMDLLLITEQKISDSINLFFNKGVEPITACSTLNPKEFYILLNNMLYSQEHNRESLDNMSKLLRKKLNNSSIVRIKESPKEINHKIIHNYVNTWNDRFSIKGKLSLKAPYRLNARHYIFLLKYAHKYNNKRYIEFMDRVLTQTLYSPMFDPIDGGVFTISTNSSFEQPLYEKDICENIQVAMLYSMAYRYYKRDTYKKGYESIIKFITEKMSKKSGYITYISIEGNYNTNNYYKISKAELKENFKYNYYKIAKALNINLHKKDNCQQVIYNTPLIENITKKELRILKRIRENKRDKLICDNRIVTGHNCILSTTLALIARWCDNNNKAKYITLAKDIIDKVLKIQDTESLNIKRFIKGGNKPFDIGNLYDYTLLLNSLLQIYLRTEQESYITLAHKYYQYIDKNFFNNKKGIYTTTPLDARHTPFKRESIMDYIKVSTNSIMGRNLLLLNRITGKEEYLDKFKQLIYNIEPHLTGSGPYMTGWGLQILNYLSWNNRELSP